MIPVPRLGENLNNGFLITMRQLKHLAVVKWKRVMDTFTILKNWREKL